MQWVQTVTISCISAHCNNLSMGDSDMSEQWITFKSLIHFITIDNHLFHNEESPWSWLFIISSSLRVSNSDGGLGVLDKEVKSPTPGCPSTDLRDLLRQLWGAASRCSSSWVVEEQKLSKDHHFTVHFDLQDLTLCLLTRTLSRCFKIWWTCWTLQKQVQHLRWVRTSDTRWRGALATIHQTVM